ncbi:hypothetical protein PTKIN_Ptkin09bG0225300 [Pterospermum kingtungense]
MVIFGLGFQTINKVTIRKERHTWAYQVMNKLIDSDSSMYKYSGGKTRSGNGGMTEDFPYSLSLMRTASDHQDAEIGTGKDSSTKDFNKNVTGSVVSKASKHAVEMRFEKKIDSESTKLETTSSILIAASKGITEMVEKILEKFPVAIQDVDAENKNVLLLAVENRQIHTFQFLIESKKKIHENVFRHWDNHGKNALHFAATYGSYRPWLIPGSALQMQWEIKWYEFVKKSLANHLFVHDKKKGETQEQIFTETHKALVKDGREWLTKTSESWSVIAALIITVVFGTATNIPGGVSQETGKPVLKDEPAFCVFAVSSLMALCFSVTALVFFLAILNSQFEERFCYKTA